MDTTILLNKFSRGLIWNGLFYTFYKALSVILSFTLYAQLSTQNFSRWGLINSTVFLLLLFLDCGLRKSIARYCPVFAKRDKTHRGFVKGLILFQASLLTAIGFPLLWIFLIQLAGLSKLTWAIFGVFAAEGMIALLRLIYHAHFWYKEFNLLHTVCAIFEVVVSFVLACTIGKSANILWALLATKCFFGAITVLTSIACLPRLCRKRVRTQNSESSPNETTSAAKNFVVHSAVMWAGTLVKALSERNVLFIYLTVVLGPSIANVFKLAHDSALFFQRMALKTIGIADTSLLSHLEEGSSCPQTFKNIFTELIKKVSLICFPLLSSGLILYYHYPTYICQNSQSVGIFIVVTGGYLFEIILSPYERVMETRRNYKGLWFSYIPYLLTIFLLVVFGLVKKLSLFEFAAILHGARLMGAVLIAIRAHKEYDLCIPTRSILLIAGTSFAPFMLLNILALFNV